MLSRALAYGVMLTPVNPEAPEPTEEPVDFETALAEVLADNADIIQALADR